MKKCPVLKIDCLAEKCPAIILLDISDLDRCPLEVFPGIVKTVLGEIAREMDQSLDERTKNLIFGLLGIPKKKNGG